jgi:uncharacterized protein YdcH (DUF465 family)
MQIFMAIALGIFSHEFMITYMGVASGVALPAAWVIFFLSLWILENIKPIKLLNASSKLLAEKRKENNHKIKQLEDKVENLSNEVCELKKQLNTIQGKHENTHTMEAELNFFKK